MHNTMCTAPITWLVKQLPCATTAGGPRMLDRATGYQLDSAAAVGGVDAKVRWGAVR